MCRVLSPFLLSLSTHLVDHLPRPECTFGNIHQPNQQCNFLPKAISYPTSSDLFSSPLPTLSKRYAIFAVPINSQCSLSSSSEVGTCRKGIRFFFFAGRCHPTYAMLSFNFATCLAWGLRSRSLSDLTQVSSPFARSYCTDLMPNEDVSHSRRVRLPVETNVTVCAVLAASLQCIV